MSRRLKAAGGMEVELPITPMLDMAFQIMIFFIVTYHPSALEVHIDGNLLPPPSLAKKPRDMPTEKPKETTSPKETDTRDSLVVVVHALSEKDLQKRPKEEREADMEHLGTPTEIRLKKPQNV